MRAAGLRPSRYRARNRPPRAETASQHGMSAAEAYGRAPQQETRIGRHRLPREAIEASRLQARERSDTTRQHDSPRRDSRDDGSEPSARHLESGPGGETDRAAERASPGGRRDGPQSAGHDQHPPPRRSAPVAMRHPRRGPEEHRGHVGVDIQGRGLQWGQGIVQDIADDQFPYRIGFAEYMADPAPEVPFPERRKDEEDNVDDAEQSGHRRVAPEQYGRSVVCREQRGQATDAQEPAQDDHGP